MISGTAEMVTSRRGKKQVAEIDPAARVMRAVRKAEINSDNPGTGFTILKMRAKPLTKLADDKRIGQIELQAAAEILVAFSAIASRMMCRGINFDRVDNGGGSPNTSWPARIAPAVARYQSFAKVWTQRANDHKDSTLAILIDAIVDERWLRTIANDQGRRVENVEKAIIGGLRDYAARAGWVTGQQGERWKADAAAVFGPARPELRKAMRRAAVER